MYTVEKWGYTDGMDKIITPFLELKFSSEAAEKGSFTGYASVFGNVDAGRDICVKGCFTEDLQTSEEKRLMLWMHKLEEPIGEWEEFKEDEKGLFVKGKIWVGRGIPRAEQAYALIESKAGGLSIGYIPEKSTRDQKSGVRSLLKVKTKEVSIVTLPMNPLARIVNVKSEMSESELMADASLRFKMDVMRAKLGAPTLPTTPRGTNGTFKSIDKWIREGGNASAITVH